ncbi:MAG TPA: ATP-binding protein [Methanoregula sp.]|nr:ATP-binding protein [Methanoregula sp.]
MWIPDNKTLFLILVLVNIVLTLMLFVFWKSQKTYDGFESWMLSLLITSCGYFLFISYGSVPVLVSTVVADLLIVLSVMMRLDSTGKFFRSTAFLPVLYIALVPGALLFLYTTYAVDSVVLRGAVTALFIVPCFLASSAIAVRFREPETRTIRYSFAGALAVTAILWTALVVYDAVTPGDHSLRGPDPAIPVFFMVSILMDIVSTVSFLLLNMARSRTDLRLSEERYRNLADNLPDYVLVHDGEFIRYANPAAVRLLGRGPGTLVGLPVHSFQAFASAAVSREFIRALRGGESPDPPHETDIRLFDGTVRHCLIKTVQIDDAGHPAFLSVMTDFTVQKAAEDALFRLNKKLTILSSITRHDIKNQLVALTGYLELSREDPGTGPVVAGYLGQGIAIARTMGDQIDFTKIYEDMGTTAPAWQNVSASIRRAVASLPMRDIRVAVDRSDLEIYADPLFEKVFYNLIDNALRYGGDAMTEIRISSREGPEGLVITCEDDGAGIPAGVDKARIFEQGYGQHTGLGLFLCREILAITGITISETGEPQKGARFGILVPKDSWRVRADPDNQAAGSPAV